jgi:MarR family transcriptional regulator, lower aerobic nicotinate degradation pathway regulator
VGESTGGAPQAARRDRRRVRVPGGRDGGARARSAEAGSDGLLVPPELHDRTDYLLCKISDTVKRLADDRFGRHGVRGAHHALLRVLDACGPTSQGEMAARLAVDPSTVVDLTDQLERGGLVVRRRNPADRRGNLVELTAEGRAHLADADKDVGAVQDEAFARLTDDEVGLLRDLLLRLAGVSGG